MSLPPFRPESLPRSRMERWRPALIVAGLALFFAAAFAQFPLTRSLPGNCDSWLAIAYSNLYANALKSALTGVDLGTVLHPATNIVGFGESAIGTSAFFLVPKLFGAGDFVAFYVMVVVIFTLSAVAAMATCHQYTGDLAVSAFAALAFTASNFTFGNIDSPHTVFFGVALASLWCFNEFLISARPRFLLGAALLAGLQVYFSAYVFVLMAAMLLVAAAFHLKVLRDAPRGALLGAAAIGIVACAPFTWFYLRSLQSEAFFNPWNLKALAEIHSLDPGDLARKLPGNIYARGGTLGTIRDVGQNVARFQAEGFEAYASPAAPEYAYEFKQPPERYLDEVSYFPFVRRAAFLGFAVWVLAAWGLLSRVRRRAELAVLGAVGLLLALGPLAATPWRVLPAPLYPLYEHLAVASLFRVPSRGFFLTAWALSVLAALGLQRLAGLVRYPHRRLALVVIATLVVLVENFPMPFRHFRGDPEPPAAYRNFLAKTPVNVLLDLPSDVGLLVVADSHDLFEYNREAIYMNWQTYHHARIFNGVHGYMPRSRMEVQRHARLLPEPLAVESLRQSGLSHITFHSDKVVFSGEARQLDALAASPLLEEVYADGTRTVFAVRPGPVAFVSSSEIEQALDAGFRWLEVAQDEDGSWPAFRGTTRFPELLPDSRIFLTALILGNLRGTRFEGSEVAARGRRYLTAERSADLLYNFDGRNHEYCCGKYQATGSALPPDVDDTSLAYIALRGAVDVSPAELRSIVDRYQRFQNADGMFPTFLVGYHEGRLVDGLPETPMVLPHDLATSLGANLNVLGFFAAHGVDSTRLEGAIAATLASEGYWTKEPYYSLPVCAHFAANARELGSAAAGGYFTRLLADVDAHALSDGLAKLSTVDLAAYLRAAGARCETAGGRCRDLLVPVAAELLRRQGSDGDWTGGWACTIGSRYPAQAGSSQAAEVEATMAGKLRSYGLENLPEDILSALLAYGAGQGNAELGAQAGKVLAARGPVAVSAPPVPVWEARARLLHACAVLFAGDTMTHFGSPAFATSLALRALEGFRRVAEEPPLGSSSGGSPHR